MSDVILGSIPYINTLEVDSLLESIEGGLVEHVKHSNKATSGSKGEGSAGLPGTALGLRGNLEAAKEEAREAVLKPTPVSKLTDLRRILEQNNWAKYINVADSTTRSSLIEGSLIEVDGILEVSRFDQLVQIFAEFISIGETHGTSLGVSMQPYAQIRELVPYLQQLVSGALPAYIVPDYVTGRAKPIEFTCALDPKYLRVEKAELDGRVTLLARIKKVLSRTEQIYLYDVIPGMSLLPPEQLKRLITNLASGNPNFSVPERHMRAQYPAVIVKPIALYSIGLPVG